MDLDFGGAVSRNRSAGQRADGLKLGQNPSVRIIVEGRGRAENFIDHVGIFSIRMKGEVTWTRAGRQLGGRRIIRRERPVRWIETINQEFVQTEIGGHGKAVFPVQVY